MKTIGKSKVYILGAGCSARNGYPVANGFVDELEAFGNHLNDQSPQLREMIKETAGLMRQENVATVDDLTARIHTGRFDGKSAQGPATDHRWREQRIARAKIATATMLISKEEAAKKTGLRNYHNLILKMMPEGRNWQERLKLSKCHVLTFNYDRLFEMAFSDRGEPDLLHKFGLYGPEVLNSGLNPLLPEVQFDENKFSFLKLHGSVGVNAQWERGVVSYYPDSFETFGPSHITDNNIFVKAPPDTPPPWPLVVFPFEKHHMQSGGTHVYYEKYIKAVWDRARTVIANASEIHIIGYSFQALDRQPLLKLLAEAKNCKRGIIQNIPNEAERICRELAIDHPELEIDWEPYPEPF